jgi:hypothetical protein
LCRINEQTLHDIPHSALEKENGEPISIWFDWKAVDGYTLIG